MSQPLAGCRFQNRCVFRQDRCSAHPDLLQVGPRHLSRCWIAQSGEPFDQGKLSGETPTRQAEAASNGI